MLSNESVRFAASIYAEVGTILMLRNSIRYCKVFDGLTPLSIYIYTEYLKFLRIDLRKTDLMYVPHLHLYHNTYRVGHTDVVLCKHRFFFFRMKRMVRNNKGQ